MVAICRDYGNRREVHNSKIIALPLQKKVLFEMDI